MTISASQAVGSVNQGSYSTQRNEPVAPATSEQDPIITSEITSVAKTDSSSNEEKNGREGEASKEAIKKAVADINKHANGTEAVFGIHEKTNRVTIKIVDKETKEVVKEVPAEKTLDLIAKVWEMAGIMVDEKR